MLQEILLSLSGVPSPIWQRLKEKAAGEDGVENYVSPPEQEMLAALSNICQLHIEIKDDVALISSKRTSLVCRAVSSSIANEHLAAFRRKVIETERSILQVDSAYVGGYQIVPLSTLVVDFAPWTRRLEWLRKITRSMKGTKSKGGVADCTAAGIINLLEAETHTGYTDLESFAVHLLTVAQNTWMRSVAPWILYGQLPLVGYEDFMIQRHDRLDVHSQCWLKKSLVPKFVTDASAENILAIGNTLMQIRSADTPSTSQTGTSKSSLLSHHAEKLKALRYPLTSSFFHSFIISVNESISDYALSNLLPRFKVIQICKVLQEYLLLGSGEFATTLIENADYRIATRQKLHSSAPPVRKLGRVDGMTFGDVELGAILSKTWADLMIFQDRSRIEDDIFDIAKQCIRLNAVTNSGAAKKVDHFSTLVPTPSVLQIDLPANSPLKIFLPLEVSQVYSRICGYLITIKRSQLRLSGLWKTTTQRRCHPTPIGPPLSATEYGRRACRQRRNREQHRGIQMRRFWSSMNKCLFLLNELIFYLQVEVIESSWRHFEGWLCRECQIQATSSPDALLRPTNNDQQGSEGASRVSLVDDAAQREVRREDPRVLAQAHAKYLDALYSALLLENEQLLTTIKAFVNCIDHFIALFGRLSKVWEGLDLQEDDGVLDAFTDFAQDEKETLSEMDRTRKEVEEMLAQIVKTLTEIEEARDVADVSSGIVGLEILLASSTPFVPLRTRTLDRLIMKLDFLHKPENRAEDSVNGLEYE